MEQRLLNSRHIPDPPNNIRRQFGKKTKTGKKNAANRSSRALSPHQEHISYGRGQQKPLAGLLRFS